MKSVVVVVLLAVAAYFLFRPTTFTVKNDIFMYRLPEDVYEFMSDLKRTVEKHSTCSIGGKCKLLKHRTRKDGVKEKLFLVEKTIPLFWDYELPFNLEIRLTLAEQNKELLYNFGFLRGYLLKLHGRMTFEMREGHSKAGTFLTEELTVTCPWLAQTFVKKNLKESHKDTLISIRNGLESMPLSRDRTKEAEEGTRHRAEGGKKTTEKGRETVNTNKKAKAAKKDEAKKSSMASGQEKASKESGQEEKKTLRKDERPTTNEKAEKKTSQQAEKTDKAIQQAEMPRRPEMDGKGKKTEKRNEETDVEMDGKKEGVGKENGGDRVKDSLKKKDEGGRVQKGKKETREKVNKVRMEETVGKEEQGKKETKSGKKMRTEGSRVGEKPEKAREPETRGQKPPETPKAEKVKKAVKAALNQKGKMRG